MKNKLALNRFIACSRIALGISILAAPSAFSVQESPKIIRIKTNQREQIIDKIVRVLLDQALTYDIDSRSVDVTVSKMNTNPFFGGEILRSKIARAVKSHQPLQFNMVGFPYKSRNTNKKVLVSQADYAERHSLQHLNTIMEKISKIYTPAATLTIFTDGMVFCDHEGVDDPSVEAYESQLKKLASDLPYLKIVTLSDLLPGKNPGEMRAVIESFEPSSEKFATQLVTDQHIKAEVEILTKRMALELDYPQGHAHTEQHPVKEIAANLVRRSLQYSNFLKPKRSPEVIRLSVHYQPDVSTKMGIKLSASSFITPWHGVAVKKPDGSITISHLEDVDLKKYSPTTRVVNGVPCLLFNYQKQ